ncbi:hypothetical protein MHW47_05960 [Streptomyces sp. OfavH-34-F]|uniref:hypothetical protein n=1 Tax=Streptomyces sp. OfavH-34-F TaxID=2917760 RepID=UPI001EF3735F|nr:hypothetical protein [Streptomyces sp. OfavH-34-F]MCG7523986.1 hypothetical protein [Streptomyces sp. OfavH-34-F]
MSMYAGVPPEKEGQFEAFMAAYANTRTVLDAVRVWTAEMPLREDLGPREIVAPSRRWLRERTHLTDGMVNGAIFALFASEAIKQHPSEREVWCLADPEVIDIAKANDQLLTVLDIVTQAGLHTAGPPEPDVVTVQKLKRRGRCWPRWRRSRPDRKP